MNTDAAPFFQCITSRSEWQGLNLVCIDRFHRILQYSPIVVEMLPGSRKIAFELCSHRRRWWRSCLGLWKTMGKSSVGTHYEDLKLLKLLMLFMRCGDRFKCEYLLGSVVRCNQLYAILQFHSDCHSQALSSLIVAHHRQCTNIQTAIFSFPFK